MHSNPKEMGLNALCENCFWTVHDWTFEIVLDSPRLKFTRLFSDSLGLNVGLFSDSLEPKFRDCFGQS